MAFLRDQAIRLLREKWNSPQLLAEELFAIFASDVPFTIDGPVTINNPGPLPAITINNGGLGDAAFSYNRESQPQDIPGFTFPGLGGIPPLPGVSPPNFGIVNNITLGSDGIIYETTGPADQPLPPGTPVGGGGAGGGSTLMGVVLSGTGDTYQVQLYKADGSPGSDVVSVQQLQIDPGATIPAGTAVFVFVGATQSDGSVTYLMQVPVWL